MQVTVASSGADHPHRLLVTVSEQDHDDVTFFKNLKEIVDFIDVISSEIRRVSIPLPRNLSELTHTEFGELLTLIANHPELKNLLKVRGFFVSVSKSKIHMSKTIGNSSMHKSCITKVVKSTKQSSETYSTIVQLEDVKELERNYVDIANPELVAYLEGLGYTEIAGLGNGTSKAVFRARNLKSDFVAVKVGKLQQSAKMCIQKELTSRVGQKMSRALFGGFLQIYKIFTDNSNNLIVIEEELANKTLRDIIIEKREKQEVFTQAELTKIIQDLVQSLYHMHVQNQIVHRDIKPQNIFYTEHRYTFGDYGEAEQKNVNILDRKIKVRMNEVKGTPMYMEPKLLRLCNRNKLDTQLTTSAVLTQTQMIRLKEAALDYDPFKADVYSLGLVFFELMLHNAGYTLDDQIETLFYWQRGQRLFDELLKSMDLRSKQQKYILLGGKLLVVPSLLDRMLEQNESDRISTFELSLLSVHKSTILSNILTPFTDIFLPKQLTVENNRYQVQYKYKQMTYEGQYANKQRNGNGIMYRQSQSIILMEGGVIPEEESDLEQDDDDEREGESINEKSTIKQNMDNGHWHWQYNGVWRNDLPNRKGVLRLNDSDNRYDGQFADGMFDGQGGVYFKDRLMYKAKWKSNYNDHFLLPVETFKPGTYRFREVCQQSLTIYGFFEPSDQPIRQFIVQINTGMREQIQNVLSQIVRVQSKTPIVSLVARHNLLYHCHQLHLQSTQQKIVIIVKCNQQMMVWLLQQVFVQFAVDALRNINLEFNEITSEPIVAIARRKEFFSLIEINLAGCYFVSQAALNGLVSSSMVNRVLKLNLSGTQTTNNTMKLLGESVYLTKLREINLSYCRFLNNSGLQGWLTSKNVKELELLDIGGTFLGKGLLAGLKAGDQLKKLRRLRIESVMLDFQQIIQVSEVSVLAGITELHCEARWLQVVPQFERLRTLHICGGGRFHRRALFDFLSKWRHNRLDIFVSSQFLQRDAQLRYFQQELKRVEGTVSRLVVPCFDGSLKLLVDVVSQQLLQVEVEKKKELDDLNEKLNDIRNKGRELKELVVRHNIGFKDCLEKLLRCDFRDVVVGRLTITGYFDEEVDLTTKQGIEISKQKIMQFSVFAKEALAKIRPRELSIPEIFQKDSVIGSQLQDRIAQVQQVRINRTVSSTRRLFKDSYQQLPICKASSNATLDQTLHALAASECLAELGQLKLKGRTNVTDRGISYVINSKHCKKIQKLDISNTCISSSVFLMLKSSDNMQLKDLCANNLPTSLNFADMQAYVMSANSRLLKRLQLKGCNVNQLDLFFLQLNLESLQQLEVSFGGNLTSAIDHIDQLIHTAKVDKLKRVFLDLSKCTANGYLKHILKVLSSPKIERVKLNLAELQATEQLTEQLISQEIFVNNFCKSMESILTELSLNFSRTNIFKSHFFEYLSNLTVKILRLTFSLRFDNQDAIQLRDSLARTSQSVITFELHLDRCTELSKEQASRALADTFRRLEKVEVLILNFSLCREVQKWGVLLQGLTNLEKVRHLAINLSSCRITDETDILCQWISSKLIQGTKQIRLAQLDITNCWHIQSNDRCFFNILKLIQDPTRFIGKIKVLMKRIRLPLVMKNKVIGLSKRPEYELTFEE